MNEQSNETVTNDAAPADAGAEKAAAPSAPVAEAPASSEAAVGDASETAAPAGEAAGAVEGGAPAATGEKKRRRRRRRKKKTAPDGTTVSAEGAEAAEGDDEEGEDDASEEAATPEGAKAEGAAKPAEGDAKKKRKRKKKRPEGGAHAEGGPHRERAAFHVGEEVFGKVTSVTSDAIMVDLSGKALAIFDRYELAADDLVPEVGDRFVAHVHGDGTRGGFVVLTRKPLREEESKPRVEAAHASGEDVHGLVTGVIKGGVEVDLDGLRAFAPASAMDLRPGADLAHFVGQRLEFKVAEYGKRGRDVVVTRKPFLEAAAKEARKAALAKLEAGTIVKGIVRTVVQYGAFISIPSADGIDGLVHMTEASHDRGQRLSDVFKVGEEIDVKVLEIDAKGKLWLSRRAAVPDPWQEARAKYAEGTRHTGKVARLQPFGAFIELEQGIDGLLHTSDLSIKPIEHPSEVIKEGDAIEVIVAGFDGGAHRIKLHPAPPPGEEGEPRQKVAPNKAVKIAVVSAESAGLVVRILGATGRSARGFIPAGHTGTARGTDLRKTFPVGTKLDAKVIEIDPRRGEAKLSLRALKEDQEKSAYNEYRSSVAKASKFGTLGDLLSKKLGG